MLSQLELEQHLIKHLTSSKDAVEQCLSHGIEDYHFIAEMPDGKANINAKFYTLITSTYKTSNSLCTEFALENYLVEKGNTNKQKSYAMAAWSIIQDIDIEPNDLHVIITTLKKRYCITLFGEMFERGKDSLNENDLQETNNLLQDYINQIQDELNEFKVEKQILDVTNAADFFKEEYDKRINNPEFYKGIPSGLISIDSQTFGWFPGQLNVLLAPTSGGKSVQLLNMAKAAHEHKKNVLYFSFEMNLWLCLLRHLSLYFEVPFSQIKQTLLTPENLVKVQNGLEEAHGENYFIYDVNIDDPTPEYVESRLRELISTKGKPDIIICDYIGNMHSRSSRKDAKDWEKAGDAAHALFKLARRYNIVILTAQQVNRDSAKEIRKNKEGGKITSIAQDAASGAQSLLHYAYYVIGLEPDRDNNLTWYHPVKMRDARFQPFCSQCLPEFNKITEMDEEEQAKWNSLRRVETGNTEAKPYQPKTSYNSDKDPLEANTLDEEPTSETDLDMSIWMVE